MIVEVNGAAPASQAVTANCSVTLGTAPASHVRALSGPATNVFIVDLWGSWTGTSCDASGLRESLVP